MLSNTLETFTSMETRKKIGILGLLLLFVVPFPLEPLQLESFIVIVFLMIFAMTWDFLSGYTGQLNFGHAMFIATGGYTSAILNSQHDVHLVLSILLGVVAATLLGIFIGLPALRLKGQYLSLLTLIVPIIMFQLVILWSSDFIVNLFGVTIPVIPEGTGGQAGLTTFPQAIASTAQNSLIRTDSYQLMVLLNYYTALVLFILIGGYLYLLSRTRTGEILTAIREDENAVIACGLDPAKFKLLAFINSGATAGLAGAIFVHSIAGSARPTQILTVELSINLIIMSIIGGLGTIVGAAIGGLAFGLSDLVFTNIDTVVPIVGKSVSDLVPLPFILMGLVFLLFAPEGIAPVGVKVGREISNRLRGNESDVEFAQWKDSTLMRILRKYLDQLEEFSKR